MKEKKFVHFITNLILFVMTITLGIFVLAPSDDGAIESSSPYYAGNKGGGKVALMINVYWGTEYVLPMLDVLDNSGAKCTFFVGGSWAKANPEVLREIVKRGHEVGNHGYSHLDHTKLSLEKSVKEIQKSENAIFEVCGIKTNLFAPPSGAVNKVVTESATMQGYITIMWTRDTIDWRDKDSETVYVRATKNLAAGDLILMHPTAHTLTALPKILEEIKNRGLISATVSQCITE